MNEAARLPRRPCLPQADFRHIVMGFVITTQGQDWRFVNALLKTLARPQPIAIAAAAFVAVVAAPFGTAYLAPLARALFWALAIGFNAAKWWLWYRLAGPRFGDGWAADIALAFSGAVLLNLSLPFEIMLLFRLLGEPLALDWASTFAKALAISLAVSALIAAARSGAAPAAVSPAAPDTPPPPPRLAAATSGLAARAGLADPAAIRAIIAEDHYLRLLLADGRTPLILYRFGDALAELGGVDGLQVHRGAWVAASAVAGAVRDGRRVSLRLVGGASVPVSERFVAAVRARGWLATPRGA